MGGAVMEPVEIASCWSRWSVKGTGEALTRLLDSLDAQLPAGWKRLREEEVQPYAALARPGAAWYSLATAPMKVGVTVSVERVRDSELRGGRAWFAGSAPADDMAAAWGQVMRFLNEGIVPAARSVGVSAWVPTAEDLFLADLPGEIAESLQSFSRPARKALPLGRGEAESWRAFVVDAFQAKAIVDERRLVSWLIHEGWGREAAEELALRFFDQCLLLSAYADEVSAA
jgi:hypothetical protein